MKIKLFIPGIILLLSMNFSILHAQTSGNDPDLFDGFSDVGNPGIAGFVKYDEATQTYRLSGSGDNIWFSEDNFSFLWKKMNGDFILEATLKFIGNGVDPHRKAGWMIRGSLSPGAPHVSCTIHGDGLASLQYRRSEGEDMEEVKLEITGPDVIRLEKRGLDYFMSAAHFGDPYVSESIQGIDPGDELMVGLFICAHQDTVIEKVEFSNIRMFKPAPDDLVQYENYIGSLLEVMDIETGQRIVLGSSQGSWQAPNWTPDGNYLIFNSDGLLYRFNIQERNDELLNTGFANRNNNDHVISSDGTMLGISHHSDEDRGQSVIYTLPITGGIPKRVTPNSPSYLHGWSPDGKYLIYTGERNGQFDIYRIPAEGGEEKQLTHTAGLDDGSEYSPDGKYIYFNSDRTGTMQIWRMRSNGKRHQQLTFDGYNDWFPHVSPDNRWIVFLSFPSDVPANAHPFYKNVYLRLLPVDAPAGTRPKVVAYLYGGQGTINVSSWSPDSKKIAFVSNGIF
ncbi:MAG TPA: biopolymer transporter TolR [Bacteroidaceae bacterium]|nr:biopolymer transporter TolR [Bacteroidaceae bacterium]